MGVFRFAAPLIAASIIFALLEIQIEGPDGWAAALPTWRVENRWTRLFWGGRPLTGYHVYVQAFVLLMLHLPLALGVLRPSLPIEIRLLAFLTLFWVLEDFVYFVLNPAFGVRRFSKSHIPWHPHWWWFLPREYWIFTPIGIALYLWSRTPAG